MQSAQFKKILLVFGVQLILLFSPALLDGLPDTAPIHFIGIMCIIASFLIPYLGYISALRDAPFFKQIPSIPKMMLLALISLSLVVAGYVFAFLLIPALGFHMARD